ncbi:MAG: hypothetical protein KC912_08180 [Proteobacteria bacterium]|nr:hypothetical protein [Pseudomonadota bacterium]
MSLLLLLLACGTQPELAPIEPGAAAPGELVEVEGTAFGEDPRAFLEQGDDQIALALAEHSDTRIVAQIPRATELGDYQLVVSSDVGRSGQPLVVVAADLERGCHGIYQADNRVARGVATLSRTFRDGRETVEEIPVAQIESVLTTSRALDETKKCSAVYLVTEDGMRLFMDQVDADLSVRAQRLASALGVKLIEG